MAYKLSSNENPYPPLPGVLETVLAAAGGLQPLPGHGLHRADERARRPLRRAGSRTSPPAPARSASPSSCVQSTAGPGDEVIYAWRSFEAYPIITQIAGATSVQVPLTAGERARPRRDGRRDHRPDPADLRLQPEQPDRHGRAPGRAGAVPRPGARATCWWCSTRRTASSSATPRCRTALELYRDRPNVVRAAHLLQGVRAGRAAGRLRDRARAGGGGAAQDRGAVRREPARPGRGGRLAARRGRAAGPGRLAGVRAHAGASTALARPGLDRARDRRRTSSGCGSGSARSTSRRPASRPAWSCGRSRARACGSRSVSPRRTTSS